MTVHVLVDASRRFDLEVPRNTTAGSWADEVAGEHEVAGESFTFKADGEVLARGVKTSTLGDVELLELVEFVEEPEPVVAPEQDGDQGEGTTPDEE